MLVDDANKQFILKSHGKYTKVLSIYSHVNLKKKRMNGQMNYESNGIDEKVSKRGRTKRTH